MSKTVKVGQTVYLHPIQTRVNIKSGSEAVIEKVGKKFAYLNNRTRFFIDTMQHDGGDYSPKYKVYLSIEELNFKLESDRMRDCISSEFRYGVPNIYPNEVVKSIYELIKSVNP